MRRAILLVIASVAQASAQPADESTAPPVTTSRRELDPAAKAHRDEGSRLFAAQQYDAAVTQFDAGYAIDPDPDFLYARSQAERYGGHCKEAIATIDLYLTTHPPEIERSYASYNRWRCQELLRRWYRDPAGLALGISGTVALGTAAGMFVVAARHAQRRDEAPSLQVYADESKLVDRDRLIGLVVSGTAGVLVTAAILRFAIVRSRHIAVVAAPAEKGGGAMSLVGQF